MAAVAIVAASLNTTYSKAASMPAAVSPAAGFTLHIDAKQHFPGDPNAIAHHWCRPAAGGIKECQIYDTDAADARLVGVEVVVPTAMWKTFPATEQALWHYHRTEIPKVSPTLPGMSQEEAKRVIEGMLESYGKVYLLWDPTTNAALAGQPFVSILK